VTPEEYLAARPDDQRAALEALRAVIASAAPGAELAMSYGVPTFKLGGRGLVSMGAAKAHCALYVMSPAVMESFADELAGLDTSKGTIRFKPGAPLPEELVRRIVAARVAEIGTRSR
jgi:uncharacterized protein YdhG (YjbR/CyaY superfamily)